MPQVGQRVLVVEDDPKTSDILRVYLEKGGYQVAAAYDGPTGVSQARDLTPDLVVLDLMLPGLSGTEVCRVLAARRSAGSCARRPRCPSSCSRP